MHDGSSLVPIYVWSTISGRSLTEVKVADQKTVCWNSGQVDVQRGRNGDPSSNMDDDSGCSKENRIWSLRRKPGTKVQVKLLC